MQSSDTTVGVQGARETAGGLISFSTTASPPAAVPQQSQEMLLNSFRGNDDKYWGWRTNVTPMFRPMTIVANNTALTNLSPLANGSTPAPAPTPPGRSLNGSRPRALRATAIPALKPMPLNCLNIAGPSCTAQWEEQQAGAGDGRPFTLLTLPDAANSRRAANQLSPLYYCLPKTPQLVCDAAGIPVLSLMLLLSRAPTPADVTIYDLIERGVLAFDLSLALPAEVVSELTRDEGTAYQPLFAREAHFALVTGDAADPASAVVASGANARAGLSLALDRTGVLDVLAALQGAPAHTSVSCQITFRCAACDHSVHLTGSWAEVYDFLASQRPSPGEIDYAALQESFIQMLEQGIVHANLVTGAGDQPLPAELNLGSLFTGFMRLASTVLQRTTPTLDFTDPANRYGLRTRPNDWLQLDLQQSLPDSGQRVMIVTASLDTVLGGALNGLEADRFIHLVSPAPGNGALGLAR